MDIFSVLFLKDVQVIGWWNLRENRYYICCFSGLIEMLIRLISMGGISIKIDYERKLKPIYIESMEANLIYIDDYAKKHQDKKIEYKIGKEWVEFKKIYTRQAVLNDSLFLRFMRKSITRNSGDTCKDFIVVKFNYGVKIKNGDDEITVDKHALRNLYYKNGVTYTYEKKNKKGEVVDRHPIHYKMLMRSTGKAKDGECVFIRADFHHKAINFLTMGLYDKMTGKAKNDPDAVFNLVALSAYQTLTTATAIDYLKIPLENILIIKDREVFSKGMRAEVVRSENVEYTKPEYIIHFDDPQVEKIINKHNCTFDREKAKQNGWTFIEEKSKKALRENGIRVNGKYPGHREDTLFNVKECTVTETENENIKNVLWDGMGLIDDSIFPEYADGFVYCRSHFFKSCLFRGSIEKYFRDWCDEHNKDYETYVVKDMFGNKRRLDDIKVIITDKSIKWLKFVDMMGGTDKKAYKTYRKYMKKFDDCFSVVKTAHPSKWGDLQLTAYQMNNSLPTTDHKVLERIAKQGINYCNDLKISDEAYMKYLNIKKDNFNINELLLALVNRNPLFLKSEFFRQKRSDDISKLKKSFKEGRLPQVGDNLTIMDNPIGLLMQVVGENPLDEGCFEVIKDGVQCYTPRFNDGERIAAFRSPHNSPNNIIHLYNVYPEKMIKYFPNIGKNVIVFNAIGTDTQARLSGHDCDTDFVFATNQTDLADLARKAYIEYPTIINDVKELDANAYHFTLEDYAKMDNNISDAQESIGTSTDTAQLALSYYYDGSMQDEKLKECFIILSVIGQISIDLAKKEFDIDVVKEINRIRNLPCMQNKIIPKFFADTKKSRNNKEYKDKNIQSMQCPMDIMGKIIEENVIKYSPGRENHIPLRDFFVKHKGIGNRYKKNRVIEESRKYNKYIKFLESQNDLNESVLYQLKGKAMMQFLNRVSKNLEYETVMQLIDYATKDENKDIRATVLNFLFRHYKKEFMNCFIC